MPPTEACQIPEELGGPEICGRVVTPPNPDEAMRFVGGISTDTKPLGDGALATVRRDGDHPSRRVVLKPVEWALKVATWEGPARAKGSPSVGALIVQAGDAARSIPPEDESLTQASYADRTPPDLPAI